MPDLITGLIGGAVSLIGGAQQANAAGDAADAQSEAAQKGIAEQRRQFNEIQRLLSPYVKGGTGALTDQMNLLGINGNREQAKAVQQLKTSPMFKTMVREGEAAILSNASATGGLRGGNVQGALAQFRPAALAQTIQQQFSNLGNLSGMGQASAAMQADAGQNSANNIANLYQQQGAAQAGGALAQGQAWGNVTGDIGSMIGMYIGQTGQGFGGGTF